MKPYPPTAAIVLTLSLASIAPAAEFDWPQWQGPDRNGVSKESGLLKEWPKDGPVLAWKVSGIGTGYGGPSVAGGRIFGISNRGEDETVWALSEKDGAEIWVTRLGAIQTAGMRQGVEGGGCTPTVEADRLYVLGNGGALACLQVSDGKVVWQRDLIKDFGGQLPTWRFNESPLIDGNHVICTPGGVDSTLIALEKSTGKLVWKTGIPDEGLTPVTSAPSSAGAGSVPKPSENEEVEATPAKSESEPVALIPTGSK